MLLRAVQKLPFDVTKDFVVVTNIAGTSNVLVVHPGPRHAA